MMNKALMLAALAGACLLGGARAGATVVIDWVPIGDAGNKADTRAGSLGRGSVSYVYEISRHEVTNTQYAAFLTAVAATADPYHLYSGSMPGISRSAGPTYTYTAAAGWADKPVNYVSWYDALRFTNWLNNGQPTGAEGPLTTEGGSYTFSSETAVGSRNPGAVVVLPTEDEWYKAAYYKGGSLDAGYYLYATGSDSTPTAEAPSASPTQTNSANYNSALPAPFVTDVGAYEHTASAYGTYGQAGNVWEWDEAAIDTGKGVRGGGYTTGASGIASTLRASTSPGNESGVYGFRVARLAANVIPEPVTMAGLLLGCAGLVGYVRRRR